jgi:hypothetical protein
MWQSWRGEQLMPVVRLAKKISNQRALIPPSNLSGKLMQLFCYAWLSPVLRQEGWGHSFQRFPWIVSGCKQPPGDKNSKFAAKGSMAVKRS